VKKYSTKDGRIVVVRQAEENDVREVIDIMDSVASEGKYVPAVRISDAQKESIAKSIREKAGLFAVAEIDGKIVGECNLSPK